MPTVGGLFVRPPPPEQNTVSNGILQIKNIHPQYLFLVRISRRVNINHIVCKTITPSRPAASLPRPFFLGEVASLYRHLQPQIYLHIICILIQKVPVLTRLAPSPTLPILVVTNYFTNQRGKIVLQLSYMIHLT